MKIEEDQENEEENNDLKNNDEEEEQNQPDNGEEEGNQEENADNFESNNIEDDQYIDFYFPKDSDAISLYKFYEISQFGSEIMTSVHPIKRFGVIDYENIYRLIVRKIDPVTKKSRREFIFLIDLDYDYGMNRPFFIGYDEVLKYYTAERKTPLIHIDIPPTEDTWCFAVFVSVQHGLILKTSLKLLFYLAMEDIDIDYLDLHTYETQRDFINFLKLWDEMSNYGYDSRNNNAFIRRITLAMSLRLGNILKFIAQFPNFLMDHVCELFLVRIYDPENFSKLLSGSVNNAKSEINSNEKSKDLETLFDPSLFQELLPEFMKQAQLNAQILKSFASESSDDFLIRLIEFIKMKAGITSITPNHFSKFSPTDYSDHQIIFFPIHIWKPSQKIYEIWNKPDNKENINSKLILKPVRILRSHFEEFIPPTNGNIIKHPLTWENVDKKGFRPDYRYYDTPRISRSIKFDEGRIFGPKNGKREQFTRCRNLDMQEFNSFYSNTFQIEPKIIPPEMISITIFNYYDISDKTEVEDLEEEDLEEEDLEEEELEEEELEEEELEEEDLEEEDLEKVDLEKVDLEKEEEELKGNLHYVICVNYSFPEFEIQELPARWMKALFYNKELSNIELFYLYPGSSISKIDVSSVPKNGPNIINHYILMEKSIDVILDLQNRGWNFDLYFYQPFLKMRSGNVEALETWYLDDNGGYTKPFSKEESKIMDKMAKLAPYLREIKLWNIQQKNPDFYKRIVNFYKRFRNNGE